MRYGRTAGGEAQSHCWVFKNPARIWGSWCGLKTKMRFEMFSSAFCGQSSEKFNISRGSFLMGCWCKEKQARSKWKSDCCWLIAFKYQSLCCSGDISRPKQSINQEWWKLIVAFNIAQNVFVAVPLLAPPPSHIHTQPWMCHSYIAVTWSFINMDTHAKPRSPLCTWHWMMSPKLWAWGPITTQMGSSTNPKSWLVCMTILIHITDSEATVAIW